MSVWFQGQEERFIRIKAALRRSPSQRSRSRLMDHTAEARLSPQRRSKDSLGGGSRGVVPGGEAEGWNKRRNEE